MGLDDVFREYSVVWLLCAYPQQWSGGERGQISAHPGAHCLCALNRQGLVRRGAEVGEQGDKPANTKKVWVPKASLEWNDWWSGRLCHPTELGMLGQRAGRGGRAEVLPAAHGAAQQESASEVSPAWCHKLTDL